MAETKTRDTRKLIKNLAIISICIIAALAVALRIFGLVKSVNAVRVGRFISSLLIFTSAIIVAVNGKELVGMIIVLLAETIPEATYFIKLSTSNSNQVLGDLIVNHTYSFVSLFILVYLVVILALILKYKTSDRMPITKKWAFLPGALTLFFAVVFVGINWFSALPDYGLVGACIAILAALSFNSYVSAALISTSLYFLVPFQMVASLNITNNKIAGHNAYEITFWVLGLLFLVASVAWLVYEIVIYFQNKKKKS